MDFIQKLKEKPTGYIVTAVILALCVVLALLPGGRKQSSGEPEEESFAESEMEAAVVPDSGSAKSHTTFQADSYDGIVVVLDPGHDDVHIGTRSDDGIREEDLNLKLANYCKEELETYPGVAVYLTRTGDDCPFPGDYEAGCLESRGEYAGTVGAAAFVSLHFNSNIDTSLAGSQIYIQNTDYSMDVYEGSYYLAEDIMEQLTALGLENSGIYWQNSTEKTYPDGSAGDYWSVLYQCKLDGVPGVIVEHAFMSNASDLERFINSEEGLQNLGVADATGIANFLGLEK